MSDDSPLLCAPIGLAHLPLEAQDRIRALRAENERLRANLATQTGRLLATLDGDDETIGSLARDYKQAKIERDSALSRVAEMSAALHDRDELLSQAFNALPDAEIGAHRLYEDLRRAWADGAASYSGWRKAVAAIGVR